MPLQVRGEILDARRVGSYTILSVTAPGIPEAARPGHFVMVGIGGEESSHIIPRAMAVYQVHARGVYGGSVDLVIGVTGPGTLWLSQRRRGDELDLTGPLGRPYVLPKDAIPCVLVGGGYGAASLLMLAEHLRERGCRVEVILGASTADRLFGSLEIKRVASMLTIVTEDGTTGIRGRVTDVLTDVMDKVDAAVVYAAGPMGMLASVARLAAQRRVYSQCAVEELMACGIGTCLTCVLPVVGDDGITRLLRGCVEGPVLRGDRIRWDALGTIPSDTFGATP